MMHYDALLVKFSNNFFQGSIKSLIWTNDPPLNMNYLDLSNNILSGEIPTFDTGELIVLKLANNNLSGGIPDFVADNEY